MHTVCYRCGLESDTPLCINCRNKDDDVEYHHVESHHTVEKRWNGSNDVDYDVTSASVHKGNSKSRKRRKGGEGFDIFRRDLNNDDTEHHEDPKDWNCDD